jgi:hypothetical protein
MEDTEGDRAGGTKLLPGTVGLDARITRKEEGIAQRSRRTQRGIGVGGTKLLPQVLSAWMQESREERKASPEGHGDNELKVTVLPMS